MKKARQWLSTLLALALLLALLPGAALATESTLEDLAEVLEPTQPQLRDTKALQIADGFELPVGLVVDFELPTEDGQDGVGVSECDVLQYYCDRIRSLLLAGNTGTIYISLIGLTINNVNEQFKHIGYYCPYLDDDNIEAALWYYSDGSYAYLVVNNRFTPEETVAWVNQVDAALDGLSALIADPSMTIVDRVMTLHDYMVANYHYVNPIPKGTYRYYYPGVMAVEQTGVCQSYSYLMQYILNRNGDECYTAVSSAMSHSWNIVAVNGEYYHVDITWDDPLYDRYGQVRHEYLLLSDETMQDTSHRHRGWDLTNYACQDDSYESAYWVEATSPILLYGGYRYYITSGGLVRSPASGGSSQLLDGNLTWSVFGSPGAVYMGAVYSGLFRQGERLYYNSSQAIKSYDLQTGQIQEKPVDVTEGYIYGMTHDGCAVTYELATGTNVDFRYKDLRTTDIHCWSASGASRPATCTQDGYAGSTYCTACGEAQSGGAVLPASGHTPEVHSAVAPTCTEPGTTGDTYCSICGELLEAGTIIPATGHVEERRNVKPVTCTENGYNGDVYCSVCNQRLAGGGAIRTSGHRWDSGTVATVATCTEDGEKLFTCNRCDETKTEIIPAPGHDYENGICSRCGGADPDYDPYEDPELAAFLNRSGTQKVVATGEITNFSRVDTSLITGHGLVYITASRLSNKELTVDTSGRTKVSFGTYKADGSYTYTFTPSGKTTQYVVRAWISLEDEAGNTIYLYSAPVKGSYNSSK